MDMHQHPEPGAWDDEMCVWLVAGIIAAVLIIGGTAEIFHKCMYGVWI